MRGKTGWSLSKQSSGEACRRSETGCLGLIPPSRLASLGDPPLLFQEEFCGPQAFLLIMATLPFHDPVNVWFNETFPKPTKVQSDGWPVIASGAHALMLAPT